MNDPFDRITPGRVPDPDDPRPRPTLSAAVSRTLCSLPGPIGRAARCRSADAEAARRRAMRLSIPGGVLAEMEAFSHAILILDAQRRSTRRNGE